MIVRSRTDLPVPEPPTSPTISPRKTSKSSLSWMTLSPNCVRTPRSRSTTSRPSLMVDELAALRAAARLVSVPGSSRHQTFASRKMIENTASSTMTQKIDSTTDLVVSWPDALGAAADLQALEAADGGDDQAEDRRLDHAGIEMPDADRVAQPVEELHEA